MTSHLLDLLAADFMVGFVPLGATPAARSPESTGNLTGRRHHVGS